MALHLIIIDLQAQCLSLQRRAPSYVCAAACGKIAHILRVTSELYHQKRKTNFCVRTDCLSFLAVLAYFEVGSYALARSCSWTNAGRGRESLPFGRRYHWPQVSDDWAASTLHAASGRLIPFNSNSPTGATFTAFSTFISTLGLMGICSGFASSQRREATLDTVPMAR